MSVAAQHLTSGARRPLRLRMRPDLRTARHQYLGRHYWVVKDPLALRYYRFEEEEFSILRMLDGECSLAEIQRRFQERFVPQRITLQELHQLVGMLHRHALLVSDAPGQGSQLLQRRREQARRERRAAVANILCVRFRGWDADPVLTWLDRRVGWLFAPACGLACLMLVAGALLLVAVHFDVFRARLPAFHDFFASQNWIWLALTLAATKMWHELGHGLACKRFGGECHEVGIMLLVLAPCLYCNVSDVWMLPSKWQRAAVGAAGMLAELVLAAACTFLWWFTEPGLVNHVCLNVMFVCSVSTVLFNANPLLRFDGYYILADLLEIPNLRQKASLLLRRKLAAWLLGIPESPDPFLPQRRQYAFALYTLAAAAYRWVISLSVFWFLYRVLEPYGLRVIGQALAVGALYGLLVHPLWQLIRFFGVPGRIERVNKLRLIASLAAAAAAVAGLFLIPLPHHVCCSLYLEPRDAASVYVASPGSVRQIHVRPGEKVREGQPLLSLANVDMDLMIQRLQGAKQQQESKLASLRQRAFQEEAALLQIQEAEESLAALEDQLQRRQRDRNRLRICTPTSGVVIAPPSRPPSAGEPVRASWSGTPLETKNLHAHLEQGLVVCRIGDPRRLRAILAVDQADLEFVRVGQPVDICLEQLPGKKFRSRIEQLSQLNMQVSPRSLSSKLGGGLLTRTDSAGRERPLNTTYQASAALDDEDGLLFIGATGQARVHTGSQTIARRVWRYLCQTFRAEI